MLPAAYVDAAPCVKLRKAPVIPPCKTPCQSACKTVCKAPVQYPRLGVPFFGDCRFFASPSYRKGITIRGKQ